MNEGERNYNYNCIEEEEEEGEQECNCVNRNGDGKNKKTTTTTKRNKKRQLSSRGGDYARTASGSRLRKEPNSLGRWVWIDIILYHYSAHLFFPWLRFWFPFATLSLSYYSYGPWFWFLIAKEFRINKQSHNN